MPTASLTSVEEYLATSYRPDRELIDGRVVERNVGECEHSSLQGILIGEFIIHQRAWEIRVLPEQRVQIRADRFRVPDLCIISRRAKIAPIVSEPPLICIEILSKDDTLSSVQDRIDDYVALGVPNIWIFDPVRRRAYTASELGVRERPEGNLTVARTPIHVSLEKLYRALE